MITVVGKPNYQRFAETWMAILAAKEGLEIVPGSVRVELRNAEAMPSSAEARHGYAEAKPSEATPWNCSAEKC